ncbi:two-component regulator propeller domain-containing protein [Gilvibacter sp.]|uniref:type IX secretion system anionic LPS delivery protein PorZ n=1 Tax=Gilvibacter sp. TaxID=2729997 RepID=UPI0025C05D27|nr:two-component regulator propeller domain-containing protein [Gilvibacter sp.]NQX77467.1 T9SS type A sorting domain-containing protein [Gilvibacter sp.]
MRSALFFVFLLMGLTATAQNFEDSWTGYFSYNTTVDISEGPDELIVAAENAYFELDLTTREITTTSSIQGLSGEEISTIYYSQANNLTIIGYANGLLEVVLEGGEVVTVVDILDELAVPPDEKRINHFYEFEDILYISTDYGISEYDLSALEFGDTFFIGAGGTRLRIIQTTVVDGFIYAVAPLEGLKRADQSSPDLIDFNLWDTVITAQRGVVNFNGTLYLSRFAGQISRQNEGGGFTLLETLDEGIIDFRATDEYLIATTLNQVHVYNTDFEKVAFVTGLPGFDYRLNAGSAKNGNIYMGTREFGILEVPFGSNIPTQVLPDGPLRNRVFAIDAAPNQLYASFGDVTVSFNPFPLSRFGMSRLFNDSWRNYSYEDIFQANDIVNVTINPADTSQVYFSSFNSGLLELREGTPTILYDDSNSPLETISAEITDIRIYGADFDREGNLWFVQSLVDDGLKRITPGGAISSVDVTSVIPDGDLALTELKVSREGFIYFGSAQNGVIAYSPNSGEFRKISEGIGSGNLPFNDVRALAFDNNNRLWIGTTQGLRVFFNVGGIFEEGSNVDSNQIIILENGVPQELLFEQPITDIEVDGSNNKWVATATSGVFYFSANGQETLLRFTKDNSPLPSNNVQDIAIDGLSGRVYFATTNGLVAFNGRATDPRDDLQGLYAFPNPVRPEYSGPVTIDGLTEGANVKITDLEGNLVFEQTSEGGSVQWDTTAFGKYRVRSGVYFIMATTEDALETKVSKIMIVR